MWSARPSTSGYASGESGGRTPDLIYGFEFCGCFSTRLVRPKYAEDVRYLIWSVVSERSEPLASVGGCVAAGRGALWDLGAAAERELAVRKYARERVRVRWLMSEWQVSSR